MSDISVRIAGRLLIDNSSVQIVPGARVGFVGRNGVGKSTLFHAIRGELPTESGTISIPPRWRVGSLAQEAPDGPESLVNVVLKADLERDALLREAETAHDPNRNRRNSNQTSRHRRAFGPCPAPPRSSAASDFRPRTRPGRVRNFPAAGVCASRSPRPCSPRLIFCCWMSRPTTLDLEGTLWLEDIWRTIRAP